ncbi:hypothetical protein DL96DRAFT_1587001 [Flagelloscypha sp. PMI_526]|nr:hypothetical protein DL96DRAFT_1587001 [Flagelloscypha sp. PMI_526]
MHYLTRVQAVAEQLGDSEEASPHCHIVLHRSQRNWSSSTIFRLPDELLAIVFESCRGPWDSNDGSPLAWTRLFSTCSRFRQVGLANPHLWTFIFPDFEKMTEIMLERSKTVPLHVFYRGHRHGLDLVMLHLHRIVAFDLRLYTSEEGEAFIKAIPETFTRLPLLRNLVLDGHDGLLIDLEKSLLHLLVHCPHLTTLDTPCRPDGPILQLRSSSIQKIIFRQFVVAWENPHLTDLLPLVQQLPELRDLEIWTPADRPVTILPSCPSIVTSKLNRLVVQQARIDDLEAFLARVSFLKPMELVLKAYISSSNWSELDRFLRLLHDKHIFSPSHYPTPSYLGAQIVPDGDKSYRFNLRLFFLHLTPPSTTSSYPILRISEARGSEADKDVGLESLFVQNPTMRMIRRLHLYGSVKEAPFPLSIFRNLVDLDHLEVKDPMRILSILEAYTSLDGESRVLPSLKTLCANSVPFERHLPHEKLKAICAALSDPSFPRTLRTIKFDRHVCSPNVRRTLRLLRSSEGIDVQQGAPFGQRDLYIAMMTPMEPFEPEDVNDVKQFHAECFHFADD